MGDLRAVQPLHDGADVGRREIRSLPRSQNMDELRC